MWLALIGRFSRWKTPGGNFSNLGRTRAWARRVLGAAAHTDWLPGCLRIFLSRLGLFRRASTRAISALGHDSTVDPVS
ncbi:unnamed protein product [Schistocephalus solidus]|uniref:Transposase n=1 Tax=Schistocephalus solidus TaxID=70667 RepID=A0A183SJ47_SCHSO|nr:unnamed protein product [Schistocephalus solidus]